MTTPGTNTNGTGWGPRTGWDPDVTFGAVLKSFLVDGLLPLIGAIALADALGLWSVLLLAFYPASALVLRGTTGRSVGDRVAGLPAID